MTLADKHIVLGLSGGIACYKSAELCRLLIKAGAGIQVVMTEGAQAFITPTTLQALSGRAVITSQWDALVANAMPHINTSREADAIVIAPASANFIARLAGGQCDEVLSLMCLARQRASAPLLIAPAMNVEMWTHPATKRNIAQVQADGAQVLGVGVGEQACGDVGDGRMLEPHEIVEDIIAALSPKLMLGKRVCITAGPTFEAIDPVRGITNRSSGKMGFAIARAARQAGAEVTLIAGPVSLATPRGVARFNVSSARDMALAVSAHIDQADIFIATAAVADWRVATEATEKIKKDASGRTPSLVFTENPDILADVASSPRAKSGALYCVGFAAESEQLLAFARAKRIRKGVPLLVGNIGPSTFGQDDNALLIVSEAGEIELPRASKLELASKLIALIAMNTATKG